MEEGEGFASKKKSRSHSQYCTQSHATGLFAAIFFFFSSSAQLLKRMTDLIAKRRALSHSLATAHRRRRRLDHALHLIRTYPALAQLGWGDSYLVPLHEAAACPDEAAARQLIALLLQIYPQGADRIDNMGCTPIHAAATRAAVEMLLAAAPESAGKPDFGGGLALHSYVKLRLAPLPVMQALLAARPQDVHHRTYGGYAPIHLLVLYHTGPAALPLLRALLQAAPDTVRCRVAHTGAYPLHLASYNHGADSEAVIVKLLLEAAPEVADLPSGDEGNLPLHQAACSADAAKALTVIRLLLQAAPQAIRVANKKGQWPLHCAAERQHGAAGVPIVQLLAAAYPEALLQPGEKGWPPLFYALRSEVTIGCYQPAVVYALLAAEPHAATMTDDKGRFALHLAAQSRAYLRHYCNVIEAVYRAYPPAISQPDGRHKLPLHLAIECFEHPMQQRGLATLLRLAPYTVEARDDAQHSACHLLCFRSTFGAATMAAARQLLKVAPQAALAGDGRGQVALQVAVTRPISGNGRLLRLLLQKSPKSAFHADDEGRTAIHLAIRANNWAAVRLLTKMVKGAATVRDGNGRVALHEMARLYDGHDEVHSILRFLLHIAPQACLMEDNRGDLPLHLCAQSRLSVDLVKTLVGAAPAAVRHRNAAGDLPLHSALTSLSGLNLNGAGIVETLLAAAPDTAAEFTTHGKLALHLAAQFQPQEDVLNCVLAANPSAAMRADGVGRLPMHYAATVFGDRAEAAVRLLWCAHAAAVVHQDYDGNLPLHLAARGRSSKVVEMLLSVAPQTVWVRNTAGRFPLALAQSDDIAAILLSLAPITAFFCWEVGQWRLGMRVQSLLRTTHTAVLRQWARNLVRQIKLWEAKGTVKKKRRNESDVGSVADFFFSFSFYWLGRLAAETGPQFCCRFPTGGILYAAHKIRALRELAALGDVHGAWWSPPLVFAE